MPTDRQAEVIAFLASPAAYTPHPSEVERHETHGAIVFLAGSHAYKIKRAVRFSYMDFSTLDLRHKAVLREVEINRRFAPDLYLGVVAITRERDGSLEIGGGGVPVEWAVQMRRFEQSALLSTMAAQHTLTPQIASRLAEAVRRAHEQAPVVQRADADVRIGDAMRKITDEIARAAPGEFSSACLELFERGIAALDRARDCLRRRATSGFVRHCHGDLHLNNIVMWQDAPMPFDALEFDDDLATIDTLYDLAFLLMDLEHAQERGLANVVLNRYLWRAAPGINIEGLVALPLFLGMRAAVRAMVSAQRAAQQQANGRDAETAMAQRYLADALAFVSPRPPRLMAVGGLSGTGKSTLAAALAPDLPPAPGALHIRTDLERKALFGAGETERLPAEHYTLEANARVYARVLDKARIALRAGHSVVVDAVFSKPEERAAIEAVAVAAGVPFDGVWLIAPREAMFERVTARTGDASDATADVVIRQLGADPGCITWHRIDAGGPREATLRSATAVLAARA